MTQRASDNGIALDDTDGTDLDGVTGIHGFSIDLSDNSDSGFWSVGSYYTIVVSAITVDGQTVAFIAATFRIGPAESQTGYPKVDVQYVEGTDATDQIRDSVVDDATRIDASALNTATGTTIPAILVDTGTTLQSSIDDIANEIGSGGDGLTVLATAAELAKVPKSDGTATWNSTAAAQIQSECNDALVAQKLDHLLAVAENDDPVDDSVMAKLAATDGDWSDFAKGTDSLQSIRDAADVIDGIVDTIVARVIGTIASGTHQPQSGDSYGYLGTNMGLLGANLTAADDAVIAALAALHNLSQADVRTAIGLAIANLDTQLDGLSTEIGDVGTKVDGVQTDVTTLLGRITATLFSGITYLSRWLGALAGKTADTTTRAEINATTAGATFNETTDSGEAIRDRGDAAWTTGGGGGGDATAANQALIMAALVDLMGSGFDSSTDSNAALRAAIDGLALGSAPQLMLSTTIASVTSQTVLVLTAGSADDNAYDGLAMALIVDQATATQKTLCAIASYAGGTLTLTLATTPRFTVAAGDSILIIAIGRPDVNLVKVQNQTVDLGDLEFNVGNSTPVDGDTVRLVPGDTYSEATGNAISFTDATWDFTGVESVQFSFRCKRCGESAVLLINHAVGEIDEDDDRVYFELTAEETAELADWIGDNPDEYSWDVEFHYAGDVVVTKRNGPGAVVDPVDD